MTLPARCRPSRSSTRNFSPGYFAVSSGAELAAAAAAVSPLTISISLLRSRRLRLVPAVPLGIRTIGLPSSASAILQLHHGAAAASRAAPRCASRSPWPWRCARRGSRRRSAAARSSCGVGRRAWPAASSPSAAAMSEATLPRAVSRLRSASCGAASASLLSCSRALLGQLAIVDDLLVLGVEAVLVQDHLRDDARRRAPAPRSAPARAFSAFSKRLSEL